MSNPQDQSEQQQQQQQQQHQAEQAQAQVQTQTQVQPNVTSNLTFFEKERDSLITEINTAMENILNNVNSLNRSLENSVAVGKDFDSVSNLWEGFYKSDLYADPVDINDNGNNNHNVNHSENWDQTSATATAAATNTTTTTTTPKQN